MDEYDFEKARESAIKFVSLKISCKQDVRRRLERYKFSHVIIDKVIDHLKSLGYINDELYAYKFINDRMKLNPKAKRMLEYELIRKGISGDEISKALNSIDIDDETTARNLLKRKQRTYKSDDPGVRKKASSFLKQRGFSYEIIYKVILDHFGDTPDTNGYSI
jgi:regulatory protein